jgi:hypothetical protein
MKSRPKIDALKAEVEKAGGVELAVSKLVCGVSNMVRDVTDSACASALAEDLDSSATALAKAVACNE